MNNIITTKNLCKEFVSESQKIPVLKNINLSVEKGEFISIMGPSGCGKSTLLYLLGGLDFPTSGEILLYGKNIENMNDKEKSVIRRRNIGFVFQFYNLVHNLTVKENILLPIIMDGKKPSDYKNQLDEILDIVDLKKRENFTPRELSGGQQQRVAIARSLIAQPDVILADEPIGNLDSKSGTKIMELFKRINRHNKITIIQVTHSLDSSKYGKKTIYMKDGVIENIKSQDNI